MDPVDVNSALGVVNTLCMGCVLSILGQGEKESWSAVGKRQSIVVRCHIEPQLVFKCFWCGDVGVVSHEQQATPSRNREGLGELEAQGQQQLQEGTRLEIHRAKS